MSTNFTLFGATGLVGSNILKYLLQNPTPSTILTVTRRELDSSVTSSAPASQTVEQAVDKDTSLWPSLLTSSSAKISPPPSIVFSALGTTRASAGGFENQYKFEHGVSIAVAQAAKESGAKTFVLISGGGADSKSSMGYVRMKGEIEDDIEKIGFERYIVVRPGLILGDRQESRFLESVAQGLAKGLGMISGGALSDGWSQSAEVIARASVRVALDESITGKKIVSQKDIIEYGKKAEW